MLQHIKRWRLSPASLGPAIIFVVLSAAAVVGFVFWSTANLDRMTLERERQLVSHVLEERLEKVPYEQASIAIWDDAIRKTKIDFDAIWVDVNLGSWMYDYFGHDRVLILNDANKPIFASDAGRMADHSRFGADLPIVMPLIEMVRTDIALGGLAAYQRGERADYPSAADVAFIEGRPAIVSVVPISSDTGQIRQEAGTEFLHVSIDYLDAGYAAVIGDQYLLSNASFATTGSADSGKATYPMMSGDGRFVTFFEWSPSRPGQMILSQTVPAIVVAFLIASAVIFVLLDQLWRSADALKAGRASAHHQAMHDPLTGLANRTRFDALLGQLLGPKRPAEHRIALLMLDLDRFKQVNDTLGHQAGDELIRAVGQRLQEIIGNRDVLARLGGDEFAIIHATRSGEREALLLSERIIDAIGKPFTVFGSEAFVGVSLGVAVATDQDREALELVRKADIALFEAKAAGRNRAKVYQDAMSEMLHGRHTIESELREAMRKGDQLAVAFQPLFSRETGRVIGAEALARWTHPRLGQVSPARFIPVAEASGLIIGLGEMVLQRACEVGARFPGLTIAVNISPAQLRSDGFTKRVFELLDETGMRAADLELEITEGILIEEEHVKSAALTTFRKAGIRIALDDFGTGY